MVIALLAFLRDLEGPLQYMALCAFGFHKEGTLFKITLQMRKLRPRDVC